MKRRLPIAIAIAVGMLVLADFFLTHPYLDAIGAIFVDWAVILGAFALILGLLNVLAVHVKRIGKFQRGWPYSFFLLGIMIGVLLLGFLPDAQGPQSPAVDWIFQNVQLPLQATVFSLLAFFAASAAYRVLRVRTLETTLLLLTAAIVLLGKVPVGQLLWGGLPTVKEWLLAVPGTAGARGILLGVALGTLTTGLRVLLGLDRPYSE